MTATAIAFPTTDTLLDLDPAEFARGFDRCGFTIAHRLASHPLFALERLAELARTLPEGSIEYNAGNVPVDLDPRLTPRNGLSPEETVRRIRECRSWMVLKNVEQDRAYAGLLDACLDEVRRLSEPMQPGMCRREGFIFVSSPGSVTPYHIDPELNFLLQIAGEKTVHMWDPCDRGVISEPELECKAMGGHRNLRFRDDYRPKATRFTLTPGRGLHFPVGAPHWVQNGDAVSVSFSITFYTRAVDRRATVRRVNGHLRRFGLDPTPPERSALLDALKYNGYRAYRRLNALFERKRAPLGRYEQGAV